MTILRGIKSVLTASLLMTVWACSSSSDLTDEAVHPGTTTQRERIEMSLENEQTDMIPATRTVLTELPEAMECVWHKGDRTLIYDITHPDVLEPFTAAATARRSVFNGALHCQQGDELAMFYPSTGEPTVTVGATTDHLHLTLEGQDGTLKTMQQKHNFMWGKGRVTAVGQSGKVSGKQTAAGEIKPMINQHIILKLTLKDAAGLPLKGVTRIILDNVSLTADIHLATGQLTPSADKGKLVITVPDSIADGPYYVALFPGDETPTITVETGKIGYERRLPTATLVMGQFYDQVLKLKKEYIEIAGLKWGLGNLMYEKGTWHLANDQWQFFNYKQVYKDKVTVSQYGGKEPDDMADHFNWGVVGENALSTAQDNYATLRSGDISGKMFKDQACTQPTTRYDEARYGDVAYWATQGTYRLPTQAELMKLTEAGYIHGWYVTKNGYHIHGYLFNGSGQKIVSPQRQITEEEYQNGVFYPNCGVRDRYGNIKMNNGEGYYSTGTAYSDKEDVSITLDDDGVDWLKYFYNDKVNGMSIRPLRVE